MGDSSSLWSGSDIPVTIIGKTNSNINNGIWYDYHINSYNYNENTQTTYDGGAYYGAVGGIGNNDSIEGMFLSLYIGPDRGAGYLIGDMSGSYFPGINMYEMDGTINRVNITTAGISPADLCSSVDYITTYFNSGSGSFSAGGTITPDDYSDGNLYLIEGEDWGVWHLRGYGEYSDTISDTWDMSQNNTYYSYYSQQMQFIGSQWSDDEIAADAAGAWIKISAIPRQV